MARTRIKMCGITRREDAEKAIEAGADALGFVFYPHSPRHITAEKAASIAAYLPPFISLVGLFVNASFADIIQTAERGFLHILQLHGHESPEFCQQLTQETGGAWPLIKAIQVATQEDLNAVKPYTTQDKPAVHGILLDTKVKNQYGGTGQTFDWTLINAWPYPVPLILAGGLQPDNVATAIQQVRPYAVDVSSGIEQRPGEKSTEKIHSFVQQVWQADKKTEG